MFFRNEFKLIYFLTKVRNRHSVEQSLGHFVEADRLEGDNKYACGACEGGRKVS